MPIMLRTKGKAEKIAHDLLGIPANIRKKARTSKLKEKLNFEESRRVR